MPRYSFGPFSLDPEARVLLRNGEPIPMAGKTLDALVVLVQNRGRLVDKNELLARVWPDTVVEEANLSQSIFIVRKILGDSPKDHRYIATVAGRGYQFVAPVREMKDEPETGGRDATLPGTRRLMPRVLFFSSAGALAIAIMVAWYARGIESTQRIVSRPLTSYPGFEKHPSFSPDGRQVAFSWNGEKQDNDDIYVVLTSGGSLLRLTANPGRDTAPSWSPDGLHIAFIREPGPSGAVYLTSPLGGPDRKVARTRGQSVCWTRDSSFIGVTNETSGISLVSVTSGEERKLTSAPQGRIDDGCAFSEDGKYFAFVRWSTSIFGSVYVSSPIGADARRITAEDHWIHGMDWMPGSKELLVGTPPPETWRLGLVPFPVSQWGKDTGSPYVWAQDASWPSISLPSRDAPPRLVYEHQITDLNLYVMDRGMAPDFRKASGSAFAPSTRMELDPQFSPDGRRVAFASDRSGDLAVWLCTRDGSDLLQLTSIPGCAAGSPKWSPDSAWLAFDCSSSGNSHTYLIPAEGGPARRLTSDSSEDILPTWSRDGRWIYFSSNRSGVPQIWKTPIETGAQAHPIQVTRGGGYDSFESPDGRLLYYAKESTPGLWSVPVEGGPETRVLDASRHFWWAVADAGIYFVNAHMPLRPDASRQLNFYSFEKRTVTQAGTIERELAPATPSLAVSHDGRRLLLVQMDQAGSDLVLVNNFR